MKGCGVMAKRSNGEGSWGKRVVKGNEYIVLTKTYAGKRKAFYGKTKAEVNKKVKEFELTNKIDMTKETQKMSYYNYCNNWLFNWRKKNLKEKTVDYYDTLLNNFLKDSTLGNMQTKALNNLDKASATRIFSDHIYSYKDRASKSTLDGLYTLLHQICKYGVNNDDFNYDFMTNVEKISEDTVKVKKIEKKALEFEQVMKLYEEMQRKNTHEFRINGAVGTYVYGVCAYALMFSCFTGMRWGEVSCLRWNDVDIDNACVVVSKQFVVVKDRDNNDGYITKETSVKSKDSNRTIPLCDQALEILEMVQERFQKTDTNLIFTSTGNPLSNKNANTTLDRMCQRAGLPHITSHELRHSFASVLLNEDEQNLYTVSKMLGHSSSEVTWKRYIHIFEKNKANTVNVFNKLNKK